MGISDLVEINGKRVKSMTHRLKFIIPISSDEVKVIKLDMIHVQPEHQSKRGALIPAQFDTALLNVASDGETGLQGVLPASTTYHKLTCIKGTGWVKYG